VIVVPNEIIHYAIAIVLFALAGFCVTSALSPPRELRSEATLMGIALFLICVGFVVGVRP